MPELMEILEYADLTGTTMVARVPDGPAEIKWGAQLTVRESQSAVFFRDGKALMVFGAGRHVLTTQNIPVLTKLVTSFGYGEKSPFRSEVYFLNMKLFRNLKWGTREPILFRDHELQMIRLRAHGIYSIQIKDPNLFLNRMVGTQHFFLDSDIDDYLKNIISSRLVNVLGEQIKSVFDLPESYNVLGVVLKTALADDFKACGLELVDCFINTISLPEDVQKMIDQKTSMHAIGDMQNFMRYKTALAIEESAKQSGGGVGAGAGLGMGVGMGVMMPGLIKEAFQGDTPAKNTSNGDTEDIFVKIQKLKGLLDIGAISQEEYDAKKTEWMTKL
ncbi:MAG: SPFH domain-containing protein [Desulfuromonadales bacterium]